MPSVTQPRTPRQVTVCALLPDETERPLLEMPLDERSLGLIQPDSPLSRTVLDGAGCAYRHALLRVYVNGKLKWERKCPRRGATDLVPAAHDCLAVPAVSLASPEVECIAEELAANRAYHTLRTTRNEWPERVAAELCGIDYTPDSHPEESDNVDREVAARLASTPPRPARTPRPNVVAITPDPDKATPVTVGRTTTGVPDPEWCREHYPLGYDRRMLNGYRGRWNPAIDTELVAK